MKNTYKIDYYGIKAHFSTNNKLFLNLFQNKFTGFKKNRTHSLLKFSSKIYFNSVSKLPNLTKKNVVSRQASLSVKSELVIKSYYLDSRYITEFVIDKSSIKIKINYKTSLVFNVLNFLSRGILQKQLFQNIIKNDIEQPLLNYIKSKKKVLCIHASAVEKDGKALVFAGLNGVGKTTLAQYLTAKKGYEYLGDNYILIDKNYAYKSPDMIRVAKDSISILGLKKTGSFGFGKDMIDSQNTSKLKLARIDKMIHIIRGSSFSLKKQSENLLDKILRYQTLEGENVNQSKLAYILKSKPDFRLNDKVKYYSLTLSDFDDLERASDELRN